MGGHDSCHGLSELGLLVSLISLVVKPQGFFFLLTKEIPCFSTFFVYFPYPEPEELMPHPFFHQVEARKIVRWILSARIATVLYLLRFHLGGIHRKKARGHGI